MRRKDKEITDRDSIESIIRRSSVCRLAMARDNQPYVVPLCFGYEDGTLYFHCARQGMKLDFLRANDAVCFDFDIDQQLVKAQQSCQWGMKYRSVIGFGRAALLDDIESKRKACDVIMRQYSGQTHEFPEEALRKIIVIKVDIDSMTAKHSGYCPNDWLALVSQVELAV